MIATTTINHERRAIDFDAQIASVEDACEAIDAIKNATRALWPETVFSGEPGFDDDGAPAKKPRKAYMGAASGEPKEGSFDAKVLAAARRLKTSDAAAIADDLDATTGVAAMSPARLRARGCL